MYDYRMYLRENLRHLRLACGYTQQAVADALGVERSTYAYYEVGKSQPSVETLAKLSRMFGVTLDQLVLPSLEPKQWPEVDVYNLRAPNSPADSPRTIGELTDEEKVLIARLRSGEPPEKTDSP